MGPIPNSALVCARVIEDGEKGLVHTAVPPVGPAGRLVPHLTRLGVVVVLFGMIGAVVPVVTKKLREEPHRKGQRQVAPHVPSAGRRRVDARHERRSCRGTDRIC